MYFDTVVSVDILQPVSEDVINGCREICEKYDELFSKTSQNSEIRKINEAKGAAVTVSDDTITLLNKGIYYGKLSNGLFDITIGRVTKLWNFETSYHGLPNSDELANALSHVDYKTIIIEENTVRLEDPDAMIDVGAIAKGFIADKIKAYLVSKGVSHALINLGGNVLAVGNKTDGSAFNIGIQKPFDTTGEALTSVRIENKSVVTSGDYQRYFTLGGKVYHHIINPETGYPSDTDLDSVTIITDSSLTADALSTTCFLMGLEEGMTLVNRLSNVDALFITKDGILHYSPNFQK
jgi:thiamine biosynthesis lipoprotein